jgi:hypothetical protein
LTVCLILDTNRFGDVLSEQSRPAYVPLLRWLTDPDGDGAVVYGGTKYRCEIGNHGKAREFFVQRWRAGRAHPIDNKIVDAEEARLKSAKACASDDEHVVALARTSGARVVCTEDRALWADVKDRALMDRPRGRVYRAAPHARLLRHDPSCGKAPPRKTTTKKGQGRRRRP